MAVTAVPSSLLSLAAALRLALSVAAAIGLLLAEAAAPRLPLLQEAQQAPLQVLALTPLEKLIPDIALWASPQQWGLLQRSLPLCLPQTP